MTSTATSKAISRSFLCAGNCPASSTRPLLIPRVRRRAVKALHKSVFMLYNHAVLHVVGASYRRSLCMAEEHRLHCAFEPGSVGLQGSKCSFTAWQHRAKIIKTAAVTRPTAVYHIYVPHPSSCRRKQSGLVQLCGGCSRRLVARVRGTTSRVSIPTATCRLRCRSDCCLNRTTLTGRARLQYYRCVSWPTKALGAEGSDANECSHVRTRVARAARMPEASILHL